MAGFRDNLGRVVQYCENVQDCRRVQQLAYFGEHFDAAKCRGMCDVCRQGAVYQLEDVTESAKALARLVQEMRGDFTLLQLVGVFQGRSSAKTQRQGYDSCDGFGAGKQFSKHNAERLGKSTINGALVCQKHKQGVMRFNVWVVCI
eukprot:m.166972 g.166972  ORF g.166972 m.166972 type:complete len:146 (+) comp14450_c0_seq14:161-598(+)